jgi:ribosome biogenesis SPOUT family RNA methylase Rps3
MADTPHSDLRYAEQGKRDIEDLLVQATQERSHFYTGSVLRNTRRLIAAYEERIAELEEQTKRPMGAWDLAQQRAVRVIELEAENRRLEEQFEAAQREADIQLGEKLAAQMTLKAVCDALEAKKTSNQDTSPQ